MSATPKPDVANAQARQRDSALHADQVYRAPFGQFLDGFEIRVEVRKVLQGWDLNQRPLGYEF
jgi:hypothetical protein